MTQTPPPAAGRWSSYSDSAPLNNQPDQSGYRQSPTSSTGLPWSRLIWAIGTGIYFLGTVIIYFMNHDPANGMEQQLMETVRISDQIMWTAFAGSLTFLVWSAYRILPSLRNR